MGFAYKMGLTLRGAHNLEGKSNTEQSISLSVSKEETDLLMGTEPSLSQQESFLSVWQQSRRYKEIARWRGVGNARELFTEVCAKILRSMRDWSESGERKGRVKDDTGEAVGADHAGPWRFLSWIFFFCPFTHRAFNHPTSHIQDVSDFYTLQIIWQLVWKLYCCAFVSMSGEYTKDCWVSKGVWWRFGTMLCIHTNDYHSAINERG